MVEIKDFMAGLPTQSRVTWYNHEKGFGFVVQFSEAGFGFGEFTFSVDKETGKASFDNEGTGMEHCANIIERVVGTEIVAYPTEDHEQ